MWMEIFLNAGLQPASLTGVIERIEVPPLKLKGMNIFSQDRIRSELYSVDIVDGKVELIQTSLRGAPLEAQKKTKGQLRHFKTSRIAKQDHILASAFQFVRQLGTEEQIVQIQAELLKRMSGPTGLLAQVDYTKENMMLGAVQGKVLDADGSVIQNWFTGLGITQAAETTFDFAAYDGTDGALRKLINQKVVRPMSRSAKGARYTGIHAYCGGEYFDQLVSCPETRETFKVQQDGAELRSSYAERTFSYGGVLFEEYSGDATTEVKIADTEVKFFPVGTGNSVFKEILSPGESFEDVGQEGKEVYSMTIPDLERDHFVDLEVYSYPAYVCQRPEMLQRGKLA